MEKNILQKNPFTNTTIVTAVTSGDYMNEAERRARQLQKQSCLEKGTTLLALAPSGTSFWAIGGRFHRQKAATGAGPSITSFLCSLLIFVVGDQT